MKLIKSYRCATDTAYFELEIYENPGSTGFIGKYWGTRLNLVPMKTEHCTLVKEEFGHGVLIKPNQEALISICMAEIERIDGAIIKIIETI
ncbi:hypothetical protein ACIPF8_10730 [Collimonas sp. NPDC087041]|uniref:hypothetical protein n=1 Tax=Collimonas sp. NPDC087041 TaxID=3363960 RepID=UPI0038244DEF